MDRWKASISRVTLSTTALLIFTAIGAFLGALAASIFELLSMALFSSSLPMLVIMPLFIVAGIVAAFVWGIRAVVQSQHAPPQAAPAPAEVQIPN